MTHDEEMGVGARQVGEQVLLLGHHQADLPRPYQGRQSNQPRLHTTGAEARAAIRAGQWSGPTAGLAPGYTQANLAILPQADAFDFLRFCVRNPKPCPVLDVTDPGSPHPDAAWAMDADLRTDVPRYRVTSEVR